MIASGGYRVAEITAAGKTVWEAFLPRGGDKLWLPLGLVRLGFNTLRPADLDLATSVPYRVKGLASKEAFVRYHSAKALEELGPKAEAAIPELIRALNDRDDKVQEASCGALRAIGLPALQPLIEATDDRRSTVRLWALRTLHGFRNQSKVVVSLLVKRLHDDDVSVRREAMSGLSGFVPQSPEMIPALIEALKDKDLVMGICRFWTVPTSAADSLAKFGPLAKAALPALIEATESQDCNLRVRAVRALTRISPDPKSAIPIILRALRSAKDTKDREVSGYIRNAMVGSLAEIATPDAAPAVPILIEVLEDKQVYYFYRASAAKALGKIGPAAKPAIPALKAASRDKEELLSSQASMALKEIER